MADKLASLYQSLRQPNPLLIFGMFTVLSLWVAAATEYYFLAGLPAVYLLVYVTLVDFRWIFYFLVFCLPISTEVYLSNGFGTDLPTEPLMVGLMLVYILYLFRHPDRIRTAFIRHPISLLILVHLAWIFAASLMSDDFVVSLKFSLAKTWYIIVFYFLAAFLLRDIASIKKYFWFVAIPLLGVAFITLARHAAIGFAFEDRFVIFYPFNRNHVNYSATLSLFVPFFLLAISWYTKRTWLRYFLIGSVLFLIPAIYFTYTRAAYLSLMIAFGAYWVFRLGLVRYVLASVFLVSLLGVMWIVNDNRYLEFAPDYDRTISHSSFDNLLSATAKGEDISTMERVYRWVAGYYMIRDKPVFGVGPGNFTNFYKSYTVTSFRTYVSDNEERSGIHSYYLMTFVEQGFPGLLIFLLLLATSLIYGERIYIKATDPNRKNIILSCLLSTVVIASFLIINDLIETDKVGTFFFLNLAILVNMGLEERGAAPSVLRTSPRGEKRGEE